ncbi:protocadherin Fat 4-like [Haliotis rubra]|uniref:protocadherin Fat 4-like n=1 Tax=Haliotis rubra TaxID=36100 RepID=UPI001EE51E2C|nr:protocadherin Fat 4-like [Haliotis rubra]
MARCEDRTSNWTTTTEVDCSGASDGFNRIDNGLTLFITDVDDVNPVISTGGTSVQEELPIGTKVYALFAVTDEDTFKNFTYQLTGADMAFFSVDTDGVLKMEQRLDREMKGTVSVTVTVFDSASNSATSDLTLTVTDINDNSPICDQDMYFINIAEGTSDENIKLMEAISCSDDDDGSASDMAATIFSGDTNNIFSFTGLEMFGSPKLADYETLEGSDYSFYLTVHVTDQPTSGPVMTGTVHVVVQVSPANEHDPLWSSPSSTAGEFPEVTISEDTQHDAVIVTYTATDDDHGVDGTLSYEIVSVTGSDGSDGSGKFLLDSINGELRVSDILDSDTETGGATHYDIVIKAVDGGVPPKSVEATQKVTLTNVNDNAPVFKNAPLEVTVAEDVSIGDVVLQLTVTDADGDTPTLSTIDSTTFTISASDLVTAASLDFEAATCYSVVMSATDGTFTTPLPITVTVTNVNDETPVIIVNTDFKIFEETPVDTVLPGAFTVNDADVADTFTYSLAGADVSYFTTTSSGDLKMADRISFSGRNVTVDVTVTDGASHSATATLTIPIQDINDNSPQCEHNVYEVEVKEGAGGYVKLKDAITCSDSDGENNSVMQINITSGDDGGLFAFQGFELWGTPNNIDYEALAATNYRHKSLLNTTGDPGLSHARRMEDNKKSALIALDTIDHDKLIHRLRGDFSIDGTALTWFQSYLSGRVQTVIIDGHYSDSASFKYSVPQGSVLGPVLFTLYITELGSVIDEPRVNRHHYADDAQVYRCFTPDKNQTDIDMSQCCVSIKSWMLVNKLKLYSSKTKSILLGPVKLKDLCAIDSFEFDNSHIPFADQVRDLGVILASDLSLVNHVYNLVKTCFISLRNIGNIRQYVTTETATTLVLSLVMSRLDYCNCLLTGATKSQIQKLQRVQNVAARIVTGENEHTPQFTSPSLSGGNFPDVSISEDTSPGTVLVSVVATDQDHGPDGEVHYEIASIVSDTGVNGNGVFFVDSISGNVYVGKALDSDGDTGGVSFYEIVIKAVDGGATPKEVQGTMKVTLTDTNDNAPVMNVVHDVKMSELAAVGDVVVEVTVTDADGDTPTLTIGGDHVAFFSVTGNQITLQSPLDYDDRSKACLSVQVNASDGVYSVMETLTVTVEPANDVSPNISVNADPRMYEELPVGTVVAGIYEIIDIDEGDAVTYNLSGLHASFFDISGSGELIISSTVDRETVGDDLTITVTATDAASNVASEDITITVVDINDNAPKCEKTVYTEHIEEASTNSDEKIMSALTCSDADAGDNAVLEVAVTGGDAGGLFQYKNMELWGDASQINYEDLEATDYNYYLTVSVYDKPSKWPALTGVVMVVLEVSGTNEFIPEFTSPAPTSGNFPDETVSEDTVPGTSLFTYVAADEDHGDDGKVHYEIVSITTDTGNSASDTFVIDRDSGILRVGKTLDADVATGGAVSCNVVIKAVDGGSPPKETQATQKLTLVGVNDNAPVFTDATFKFLVAEDVAVGHVVATLGIDEYDGDVVTLSVTGSQAAVFAGDATQPNLLTLATLDYETTKCYSVEVVASDGGLQTTRTLTIAVTDVADVAPKLTAYDFVTIPEQLAYGTVIGRLFELSDVDTQDIAIYTLSGTDSGSLAINETSGRVFIADAIDADSGVTSLSVTVTVTDSASLTGTADVDVAVLDVNEFAPVFGDQIYKANVEENSASAKLLDVVCTDDDTGVNGEVELVIPTTNGADTIFSVSAMEVHVDGTQLDYEALADEGYVYSLTLLCRDKPASGNPRTGSVLVSVQVSGTDETPPVWFSPSIDGSNNFPGVTLSEGVNPGALVQTFIATDVDQGTQGNIIYSIVSVTSDSSADGTGMFGIDATTGDLQTTVKVDADTATGGDSYYDIVLQASDGTTDITGTIRVTLTDYSDNAPKFTKEFYTTTVPCTTSVGTTVLSLAAEDIDSVGSAAFRFNGYSGSIFTLETNTGAITLTTPTFHIGDDIYHTLAVTVTDTVSSDLTDEATVYIEMEYCGPSNASTSGSTETPACQKLTDDSALVPMRIATAVLAAVLIGVLGFSLRSILSALRPEVPKGSPISKKNPVGFERPLQPEPSIYFEDMTVEPSVA